MDKYEKKIFRKSLFKRLTTRYHLKRDIKSFFSVNSDFNGQCPFSFLESTLLLIFLLIPILFVAVVLKDDLSEGDIKKGVSKNIVPYLSILILPFILNLPSFFMGNIFSIIYYFGLLICFSIFMFLVAVYGDELYKYESNGFSKSQIRSSKIKSIL